MSWGAAAEQAIQEAVLAGVGEPLDQLEKRIRANYPFGQRQYHPYKVWLKAVREVLKALSTPGRRSLYEECLARNPRLKPAPDPLPPPKRKTKAEKHREAEESKARLDSFCLRLERRL